MSEMRAKTVFVLVLSFESGASGCVSLPARVGRGVLFSLWRG
jgi:hypothetical protein